MVATDDVELAARESYGRLLAWLTARSGSIATAEDALGDALVAALTRWPVDGIPRNPEAWLLTVARRRLIDEGRRAEARDRAVDRLGRDPLLRLTTEAAEAAEGAYGPGLPDRRLELLFLCAHPSIPTAMRTPLMLQSVLGLTAQQIGSAMLVPPSTIGQRLVRVKRRLADEGISVELPTEAELTDRLGPVLDAVYAAYTTSWDTGPDPGGVGDGLAGEAIWLAGLLIRLLPAAAEAKGLYALVCLCESRRPARRDANRGFVPLEEQDPAIWDRALMASGEAALRQAAQLGRPGRYQLEAAIHSQHANRARTGVIDWLAINGGYRLLVAEAPSLGAVVGCAASFGRIGEPEVGLRLLDDVDPERFKDHQPHWAVRAWLLARSGRTEEADHCYERAIGLCIDPAVRVWLVAQRHDLGAAQ